MSSRLKNLTREFGAIEGIKFYTRLKTKNLGWFKSAKKKMKFFLRNNGTDPGIFGQIFIDRQYAYPITFEPKTILDLGANTGLSALYFADRFPKAQTIMLQEGWETIDILKIDIEGSEKELFSSNYEKWLPATKLIFVEVHDDMKKGCSKAVFSAIGKYNFHFSMKHENLIFINQDL